MAKHSSYEHVNPRLNIATEAHHPQHMVCTIRLRARTVQLWMVEEPSIARLILRYGLESQERPLAVVASGERYDTVWRDES